MRFTRNLQKTRISKEFLLKTTLILPCPPVDLTDDGTVSKLSVGVLLLFFMSLYTGKSPCWADHAFLRLVKPPINHAQNLRRTLGPRLRVFVKNRKCV